MSARVGIGIDAHAFDLSRTLVLGGVEIDDHPGLAGHSDADVVCHSVIDALFGACALGDLGEHFPPEDRWKDASSVAMLSAAVGILRNAGWAPNNIDVTVVAESPRLGPHISEMTGLLAQALGLEEGSVSIKATTTDGLGFTGRKEGIAALAVATVRPLT
ncbi:MAG: 2-C-methyl-D-erythritol 2,4-cyclodiphosphate synthase [Actinomycetota bacterium]